MSKMKADFERVTGSIGRRDKSISLLIVGMTKEARKRIAKKILKEEPILIAFLDEKAVR